MKHEYSVLLVAVIAGYATALLVSYALVRWTLPERQTRDTHRYLAIDGVRGYLALGVFLGHFTATWFYLRTGNWAAPPFNFEAQIGKGSVAIFFMITAFLFWQRVLDARSRMDWNRFFVSRLFRIYPLYVFAFLLVAIAVGYKSGWVLKESLGRILFETVRWMGFRHPDINKIVDTQLIMAGVNWTLQYELWFYLALPLVAGFILLKNPFWRRLVYIAVAVALFTFIRLELRIAVTFLGGIVAAYWVRDPRRTKLVQGNMAAAVGGLCFLSAFFFVPDAFSIVSLVMFTIFFVVVSSGNTLFGLLSMRPALWMGEISYSIYLLHGFILWTILQNVFPNLPALHNTPLAFTLATVAITIAVFLASSATFLLIEKPFITFGKNLVKRGGGVA
jgi:peptidoglycan/LPS O-acetylase OafA/YrhL